MKTPGDVTPIPLPDNTQRAPHGGIAPDAYVDRFIAAVDRISSLLNTVSDRKESSREETNHQVLNGQPLAFSGQRKVSVARASKPIDMGPLKPLLDDETVNDILVNGPKNIFVERRGKIEKTGIVFPDHESLEKLAHEIVTAVGRKLDARRPLVDARLLDGSRVNIIAPPMAIDGISISIRKFARDRITLDKMAESGCMTKQLADFLGCCGRSRANIVVSGGTGAGKTTLMNAVSRNISPDERIVTIEDSAELQLQQPHVVRLETKDPENLDDRNDEVTMRDLVRNALRMRPDRIIVGEVRGREAFDMIQAMNTGHDGSLTTVHANTSRDALARIENMVLMANLNLPPLAIRKQIVSAIHFVIQLVRMSDGVRRILTVSEIVGIEGDVITMQDIFKFQQQSMGKDGKIIGVHQWTGVFPRHPQLTALIREKGVLSTGK